MSESNSSTAAIHNIICKRGDTFFREFRFYTDESKTTPMDITDHDFKMTVISCNNVEVLKFSLGAGFEIESPNKLKLSKTNVQMQIPAGDYRYDIQQTTETGFVKTIIQGKFIVERDRT